MNVEEYKDAEESEVLGLFKNIRWNVIWNGRDYIRVAYVIEWLCDEVDGEVLIKWHEVSFVPLYQVRGIQGTVLTLEG